MIFHIHEIHHAVQHNNTSSPNPIQKKEARTIVHFMILIITHYDATVPKQYAIERVDSFSTACLIA